MPPCLATVAESEKEHNRSKHQHAHELHERADLATQGADGKCRRQHLGNGVHGEPSEHTVLEKAQVQWRDEKRQSDDDNDAENGGKGDR